MIRNTSADAAGYEYTAATQTNLDVRDNVSRMMKSLNSIVYVVILSAALLAFIVLYNLTNINITERIREIATIKVLGFYQLEVSQYVFRENLFLTACRGPLGYPDGRLAPQIRNRQHSTEHDLFRAEAWSVRYTDSRSADIRV